MVDIEDQQELSRQDLTDYAYVTLDGVEKATGVKPILYTYLWFLDNAIFWEQLKRWPLSLARWTEDPSWPDSRAVFWQYSANRSVSWAVGPVDFQRTR